MTPNLPPSAASSASSSDDLPPDLQVDTQVDSHTDPHTADPRAELPSRLDSLASAPSPPSSIDIDRALADGRTGRRKRTVGILSWSAASLTAASLVAALAVAHSTATDHDDMTAPPAATATETTGDAAADAVLLIENSDPVAVGARFGWLPDSVSADHGAVIETGGIVWGEADGRSGPTKIVRISTFPQSANAQNALEFLQTGWAYKADGQTAVDSHPAYWLTLPANGTNGTNDATQTTAATTTTVPDLMNIALVWQLPNGSWAVIDDEATGATSTAMKADLVHMAETATVDAAPLALPLRLTHVPEDAGLSDLDLQPATSTPGTAAAGENWSLSFSLWTPQYTLDYDVAPAGQAAPATLGPSQCTTSNGVEACINLEAGSLGSTTATSAQLRLLTSYVQLTSADPSTWTTTVFTH